MWCAHLGAQQIKCEYILSVNPVVWEEREHELFTSKTAGQPPHQWLVNNSAHRLDEELLAPDFDWETQGQGLLIDSWWVLPHQEERTGKEERSQQIIHRKELLMSKMMKSRVCTLRLHDEFVNSCIAVLCFPAASARGIVMIHFHLVLWNLGVVSSLHLLKVRGK